MRNRALCKNSRPVQIEIRLLGIDAAYQAPRRASAILWAKRMVHRFDVSKLGVIEVSLRADGSMWVIDGMARLLLLREMGGTHLWATIHRGLTYEQEADMFVAFNRDKRKSTPYQEFVGDYEAKKSSIVIAVTLARKYGFDLLRDAPGENVIRAYNQIRKIVTAPNGPTTLENVFQIICTCWTGLPGATQGDLIRALAHFLELHGNADVIAQLTQRLKRVAPDQLHAMSYAHRNGNAGGGGFKAYYRALGEIYNKGRRTGKVQIESTASKKEEEASQPVSLPPPPPLPLPPPVTAPVPPPLLTNPPTCHNVSVIPIEDLVKVFRRGEKGACFLFREDGAELFAKRLRDRMGDKSALQFARDGRIGRNSVGKYLNGQYVGLSPEMVQACDRWGVLYQDLLIRQNGHSQVSEGDVVFDATSSRTALDSI
jgi:hypothetical protein